MADAAEKHENIKKAKPFLHNHLEEILSQAPTIVIPPEEAYKIEKRINDAMRRFHVEYVRKAALSEMYARDIYVTSS